MRKVQSSTLRGSCTAMLRGANAQRGNIVSIGLDRVLRKRGADRGARHDVLRLSWRKGTVRDREHTVSWRPAGALRADPAFHVPREAARLRSHERDCKATERCGSA